MSDEKEVPLVNIKRENYVTASTASGGKSLHNDDIVARGLAGLNLDALYEIAAKFLAFPLKVKGKTVDTIANLADVYDSLNVGMQRMNLGNRIRARVTKIDTEAAKAADKAKADGKEPKATKSGSDLLATTLVPFIKVRDAAVKQTAEKKAAKVKAAAADKATEAKAA